MSYFDFMNTAPQGGDRRNNRNAVTIGMFFESEDNNGYVKLETFKALIKQLEQAPSFKRQYATFFDCAKDGHLIYGTVERRTQRQNQKDYIHLNLRRGRMNSDATVYLFDNLEKFIRDYAERRISVDFNWNDIVEFCNNH